MEKKILTAVGSLIALAFTAWFISNYPPHYPATNYDVCKEYKTAYEVGFCEGYNWAGSQLQIDNAVRAEFDNARPAN
jgi:hypothetical protein